MEKPISRLLSLDVLRGITIILMIIVNNPGSWSHVFTPLLHASWNGITPTDYVFPSFLFILGVSVVLSISKQIQNGITKKSILKKIVWRSIKIYLVGLFLWLWPDFNFDSIRWVGVLQRLSIVFLVCGILYLYISQRTQLIIGSILLIGYCIVIKYLPVPGIGIPDLSLPEKNWAHYIDKLYLPGYLWKTTWDPEGILSTFPAVVTGILGMLSGYLIIKKNDIQEKIISLFLFASILLILGDLSSYIVPLNKSLWSSSYTLMMGGISCLLLVFFIYWVDVKNNAKYFNFAHVFGVNAIFAYTLSGLLITVFYSSKIWGFAFSSLFMEQMTSIGLYSKFSSLLYAVLYLFIIWIPTYILYKRKIFIKL